MRWFDEVELVKIVDTDSTMAYFGGFLCRFVDEKQIVVVSVNVERLTFGLRNDVRFELRNVLGVLNVDGDAGGGFQSDGSDRSCL